MPIAADRPGAAPLSRAVTLRIKRGAKLLSDVKIGRSRVIVGGGKTAQLRLKNAGLADECLVIDTRNEPFGIESRLGPDDIRVNGRAILSSLIRLGDIIEISGLTLELVEGEPAARATPPTESERVAAPAPAPAAPLRAPAARPVLRPEVARAPAAPASPPPGRPIVPPLADPIGATRPSARPPWIELVGDDSVAEARLYLQDGTTAGRQGDVRVRHPSVSKKHAKFTVVKGRLFVEDLGSTNGVWINRERITAPSPIVEGDTLHLGAVEFAVRVPVQAGAEVTNFAAEPEPSMPPARLDRPSVTAERAPVPGMVPRAHDAREKRTEAEGAPSPSPRFGDPWADDPGAVRDRGTERELPAARGAAAGIDRLTEREEARARSPFEEAELEEDAPPTGTGRPGRRERTDREQAAAPRREADRETAPAPPRLSSPPPLPRKPPTPSALFGDVEDLSEKYSTRDNAPMPGELELERRPERVPVRTTVRPSESFADAIGDEDFVPRKRRSFGKMIGVAALGFMFGGFVVGVLAIWPKFALLLAPAGPIADVSITRPDGGDPGAVPTAKPKSGKDGKKPAHGGTGTKIATGGGKTVPVTSPDIGLDGGIDGGDEGPVSIFDGAPVDLRGDGRLDKELASLEKDGAEKGLRVEKAIGSDELKSIFLGSESAVVRKLHRDDGFEMAPSAADEDPRDAEAKRQGAKQIDPNRVNALIRDKFPAVKKCLVGASVRRGKARVLVEFTIQPSGKTENVSVVDSDIGGSGFKSCVSNVVRGIKFPKTKDQSVVVQFPFVFTYN